MTYSTEIVIWSRTGHTPLTNRSGAFCDELVRTTVECSNPGEAETATRKLISETKHGSYGHFYMPKHPNQNIRTGWVGSSW